MTWDMTYFLNLRVTMGKTSDRDMRHCHFLNSTCDFLDPHIYKIELEVQYPLFMLNPRRLLYIDFSPLYLS